MAACGSLQHIFDNILPENPTLLESLSTNQIKPIKSIEQASSFTEIFGELYFKESPVSSPSSSHVSTSPSSAYVSSTPIRNHTNRHKSSESFSSLSSESLQLCTEGLGFESSDDVEYLNECWETHSEKEGVKKHLSSEDSYGECRRSRVNGGEYPPPISCMGRNGKPWVCFRSYRSDGRFVLKEIRIPTQEFLHAYREDGRLKLHFVQPDDEFLEEEDDDDDDVEGIDEEEYDIGKENDDCVRDHVNEEKEIDAQVNSN
ncbi:uncharacterized protein LOC133318295 [Gastrolobium bilobum]|uniref:uncharacterized protein LOC133318295 n=1 Tax=Gastrolobium bilobum TaxID=150636 RepID=UPI002AAF3F9E|nr:uncharacterized protein LOC133318295 [Gastrolobium bilobum]